MSYSYGCRVDADSNAITVIDEENKTATTKGYVNGEYVEFGSGGGGASLPTVKYSADLDTTSITCDTSFDDVVDLIQNAVSFLLFVFFENNDTNIALAFPPGVVYQNNAVYFETSFTGLQFRVVHTADSITISPLTE